jgi:hypothetical protein
MTDSVYQAAPGGEVPSALTVDAPSVNAPLAEGSDRELLERAAKAASAEYEWDEDHIELITPIGGGSGYWNPLTDDGDAFRLAVTLDIDVFYQSDEFGRFTSAEGRTFAYEHHNGDALAATRRAIVRAAAAMASGKWQRHPALATVNAAGTCPQGRAT